jgi:hypothetical protein
MSPHHTMWPWHWKRYTTLDFAPHFMSREKYLLCNNKYETLYRPTVLNLTDKEQLQQHKYFKHTNWKGLIRSSKRWATSWTIGVLGFDCRRGLGIFLFTTASRTVQGPTQPPIQWVPRELSLGVKRPGREDDHSPPSSAEVKEWSYTSTPPIRLHGVVLT